MRAFAIFIASTLYINVHAQNHTIICKTTYLSSKYAPAVRVKISSGEANTDYTTNSGVAILYFPDKSPGDALEISIGKTNSNGDNIEVINKREIELLRMPRNADDTIYIKVCLTSTLEHNQLVYYKIISKPTV